MRPQRSTQRLLTLRRSYGHLKKDDPLLPEAHLPKGSALCTSSGNLDRILHIVHACACDDAGASYQGPVFRQALANSLRLAAGTSQPSRARRLCLGVLRLLLQVNIASTKRSHCHLALKALGLLANSRMAILDLPLYLQTLFQVSLNQIKQTKHLELSL